MRKKLSTLLALAFVCCLALPGCGRKNTSVKRTEAAEDEAAEAQTPSYASTIQVGAGLATQEGRQYATLSEAFAYVNANPPASENEGIRILVSPGTYREHLILSAPYITLEGDTTHPEEVRITWYYGCGRSYHSFQADLSNPDSASLYITSEAHDFTGLHLTFENSYSLYVTEEEKEDYSEENTISLEQREKDVMNSKYKTQALALCSAADRTVFWDCRFLGVQDTLLLDNYARCYLKDCFIEGTTDFIFGSATAVFDQCQINVPFRSGYLTASSAEASAPYGFLFVDCSLTREASYLDTDGKLTAPEDESCALGRPWKALCQVIFWNCKMDNHILSGQDRYVNMTNEFPRNQCRFMEGNTMDLAGNLLDLSQRLPDYVTLLSQEAYEAEYTPEKHLAARYDPDTQSLEEPDNWNPMQAYQ
jgi:pectinesterase